MRAIVPIRSFETGKARLTGGIEPAVRPLLTRQVAARVVDACIAAELDVSVVTADAVVAQWASDRSATVVPDPGSGLNAACTTAMEREGGPWMVLHADLPLIDTEMVTAAATAITDGMAVIAPSRDGGTNLIGQSRPLEFGYGPGSYHRHLGRLTTPHRIVIDVRTLVELDTPADLSAAVTLPGGRWVEAYLG